MDRTFASTLAQLRKEKHFSQRKVAADLNISQALLSHYENGAREPGLDFLCKVCDYYNVSSDYILCRTEQMHLNKVAVNAARDIVLELKTFISRAEDVLEEIK